MSTLTYVLPFIVKMEDKLLVAVKRANVIQLKMIINIISLIASKYLLND